MTNQKFISFLEALEPHEPDLVGTIMEGYLAIYEGPVGKFLGMLGIAGSLATAGTIDQGNVVSATNDYVKKIGRAHV